MNLLNRIIDSITKFVMGISAVVLFLVTFAQVIFRYVLKSPLPWSQDVLRLAFTYLVFWGAAWCVKEKGHLNIDVLLTAMPRTMCFVVELIINLVLCGFFVLLIVYGYNFALGGLTQTAPYLLIPMSVYYASIPSAAVLMLYYMVQIIIESVMNFIKGDAK